MKCSNCKYFERDKIGSGQGIGRCLLLEEYKLKIAGKDKQTIERLLAVANRQLDCHLSLRWPDVERNCKKFEQKLNT